MMDWLIGLDHEIILALNAMHTPFWDAVMLFLSSSKAWIPLYVLIAVLMFVPRWYGRRSVAFRYGTKVPLLVLGLTGVLAAALCFGITDQLTNIVKNLVERPRPGHDPLLEGMLHLPQGTGGQYGFFSAHASNTFGLAVLTALIFRRCPYTWIMLLWAAAVSFSRIYLARHFVTDVLCGALFGVLAAFIVYWGYRYILGLISVKYDRNAVLY